MNITILGGGAWGSALAVSVAAQWPTVLWVRSSEQADAIAHSRRNDRYLPGVGLPASLAVTDDFDAAVAHAAGGLVIVATPIAALDEVLRRLSAASGIPAGVFWLCKGFDQGSGSMGHEIARSIGVPWPVGVLSGPSFALEVARGQPTALVAASHDPGLVDQAVAAFHHGSLRIYSSADPVGVEVGGAVKNVIAIATGIADGMAPVDFTAARGVDDTEGETGGAAVGGSGGVPSAVGLGLNARAALITRGLAEMSRLGMALGARPETFMGLSGLGDLVLTATGELSRNRQVGRLLAQGRPLARILAELGHVAEGVASAPMVVRRAAALGVDMPIAEAVVAVLEGRATPAAALEQLMGREARPEKNGE